MSPKIRYRMVVYRDGFSHVAKRKKSESPSGGARGGPCAHTVDARHTPKSPLKRGLDGVTPLLKGINRLIGKG